MRMILTRPEWTVILTLILLINPALHAQKEASRPNIIFIMSDDHAYQAVSAYNRDLNKTPNIDRIAEEGVLFNRATVTNSLCAPSRAVILTGKYSHMNGKIDIARSEYDWDQDNFAKQLQTNGYQTAIVGKVHLEGEPQGFDYYAALIDQGEYYNPNFIFDGDTTQVEGYVTDLTTDFALDWISNRNPSKPFAVLLHHKAPHREWLPALRHLEEYTHTTYPEPKTLFEDYSDKGKAKKAAEMNILTYMNVSSDTKIPPEIRDSLGIIDLSPWSSNAYNGNLDRMNKKQRHYWDSIYAPIIKEFKEAYPQMSDEDLMHWKYQRYMQDYLGTIASIDDGVGRVLDYLEENDLAENTIVVYTSDQGFYLGEHGWFDKRFMYEESLRTPLVIRYPKEIKPGSESDALVQNLDFAPTLLDYAGINPPKDMQGHSFRNLLRGKTKDWRDAIYYSYYAYPAVHQVKRHYGISTDRYKLIHFYYDIDEWELYDLKKDPHELRNVYEDPDYAKVREHMHEKLRELRKKYKDSDENDQKFIEQTGER